MKKQKILPENWNQKPNRNPRTEKHNDWNQEQNGQNRRLGNISQQTVMRWKTRGNGWKTHETAWITFGPRGLGGCRPWGLRARHDFEAEQQQGEKDSWTEPQKEKREKMEQTSIWRNLPKQTKNIKPHIQKALQVSELIQKKTIHRHILVKLKNSKGVFFTRSRFLKEPL